MTDKENKKDIIDREYKELVMEVKKELPNIVLPSMGMLEDVEHIEINGKDYIISNEEE